MDEAEPVRLTVGHDERAREVAVARRRGRSPGLFWLGGFRSDMTGSKATAADALAARRGRAAVRFDYSGHGQSGGRFEEGTIGRWLEEAVAVFDRFAQGPQIVIGSSMGGWIALLLAEALRGSGRIGGLILIAPAVDMTEALIWNALDEAQREELMSTGILRVPSAYADEPDVITRDLIEDGRTHLFGDRLIETGCPVHILQGVVDAEVPWRVASDLVARLASEDVVLTLVKDGDHRLSRPQDIERLEAALTARVAEIGK
jgi:pimeloyl-ACP methyl ester carboxylesterase